MTRRPSGCTPKATRVSPTRKVKALTARSWISPTTTATGLSTLCVSTPDQTRFAAARADRSQGNFTVFHNGIYTACEPCKDDPKKPPLWQIKAARIIHDQQEKMIYFEDATLDFFGKSLMLVPYFSAPDPTVKRRNGFLIPTATVSTKTYGFGVEIPFYWAIAPNYDATFAPKITTREGVLWQGEFRQRLLDGAYAIRGSAIDQTNPSYFVNDANRTWRGSVESEGKFAINKQWTWGWEAVLLSDKYFLQDYTPSLSAYRPNPERLSVTSEAVSQVFISGGVAEAISMRARFIISVYRGRTSKAKFRSFIR